MISALTGDGVGDLKATSPKPCRRGRGTTRRTRSPTCRCGCSPPRSRASGSTTGCDELPYATTVETTSWAERNDGSVRVEQTIFVERDSQKSIVLGKGGCVIRQISMEAREELARLIEQPVHLFLFVKVREDWGNDPERYRELGLGFPKE